MTRVLATVAHPDDEVLGVGGTLLRHAADGDEVHVAICHPCRVSSEEIEEAEKRMGVVYDWYTEDLDKLVRDLRPDIVYTHSRADLHQDHQDVLQRTLVACRPQSGVRDIYCFETPSATDWSGVVFDPRLFVAIGDTIEAKLHAMEAYASELRESPHPRNTDRLMERGLFWGQRIGIDYAEAFEVIRECW